MPVAASQEHAGLVQAHEESGCDIARQVNDSELIVEACAHVAWLLRGEARPGINVHLPHPAWSAGPHPRFRGCDAWAAAGAGGAS